MHTHRKNDDAHTLSFNYLYETLKKNVETLVNTEKLCILCTYLWCAIKINSKLFICSESVTSLHDEFMCVNLFRGSSIAKRKYALTITTHTLQFLCNDITVLQMHACIAHFFRIFILKFSTRIELISTKTI